MGGGRVVNWVLLAYASDLARFFNSFYAVTDEDAELPDILAHLLLAVVERQLRRRVHS